MSSPAASPFSFHCMICFEEFDPEDRYPVVLPCGHTYVCHVCAQRLDKCMECRTTLNIWTADPPPPKRPSQSTATYASSTRWSAKLPSDLQNKKPPTKTRLPLPKNVVLLSLMEATELATERSKPESPASTSTKRNPTTSMLHSEESEEEEEEEEEQVKIREGTSLAVSECGTYVVRSRDGLLIFPSRPNNSFGHEEDVDTLVRFFHMDSSSKKSTVGQLSFGDRVQIVSVEKGGWAKLARGYGFVHADEHQIVKVGGSMDRACRLEAMLHSLSSRRKLLRREQSKVDSRFVVLMNELQTSLLNDEDLTVIVAETFSDSNDGEAVEERDTKNNDNKDVLQQNNNNTENNNTTAVINTSVDLSKPIALVRQETPQALMQTSSVGCGFSFSDIALTLEDPEESHFEDLSDQNQSAMLAGARAWREREGRQPSTGIDFRTGLSGHMALLSTHAHPHEYLGGARGGARRDRMMGMSNHTGLSTYKSVRKAPSFPPDG